MTTSVTVVPAATACERIARTLHVPGKELTVPLLAQALRRAIHILAPCPRHELQRAVRSSLTGLGMDDAAVESAVADTTETLLVYGDILEMRPLQNDAWRDAAIVLRPAPPSFVSRADGTIVVIGVAGDEITPFAGEMNARVAFRGPLRLIAPEPDEDLPQILRDLGLLELSEAAWLRLPPIEPADAYVARWSQELSDASKGQTAVPGLRVLSSLNGTAFHRDRWIEPAPAHSGMHVARRPQKYGSDIWCLVDLAYGQPIRFLDLVSRGDRLRPCDLAWRIQMAMDAQRGSPQRFRIRPGGAQAFIDFFAPLPSWAERKLAIAGERIEPHNALLSFSVPDSAIADETPFLEERLWLKREQYDA